MGNKSNDITMRLALRSLLLLLSLLCLPALSLAQGNMEVIVFDPVGKVPVAGVRVDISNPVQAIRASGVTDARGRVFFAGLETSGSYEVKVLSDDRYNEAVASDVLLRNAHTQGVALLLHPIKETTLDQITVTAETGFARRNSVNAEVASSLGGAEVNLLPVESRDLTRALYRLPNVSPATGFYPEAPNVSVNGANGLFVNYMIDGLDNNENFLGGQKFPIPVGMVQDVSVLSSSFSAEHGRTGNGVFNVTTKSGGNEHAGEFFYGTRPGSVLDASSPYNQRDLSGNAVKDGFSRQQVGFAVGGPIQRNRTFYFVNFEQTRDTKDNLLASTPLGVAETVRGTNSYTLASAKVSVRWSDRSRSSLRGHLGRIGIDRQGGGLEGGVIFPSAANTQDRNSVLVALQNTWAGRRLAYEGNVLYGRFRWNYARTDAQDGPQVTVLDDQGLTAAVLGHPGYVFDETENTLQLQQKLTWFNGRHRVKGGFDVLSADFRLQGGGNPNGNYLVQLTTAQLEALRVGGRGAGLLPDDLPPDTRVVDYAVELRPATFGTRQSLLALFLEDQIAAADRLTVTVGLRYDYDTLTKSGSTKGDLNNLAPRLGFNWSFDERSSLRGGYGIYYDKIVYAVHSDALQQNSTSQGFRDQLEQLIAMGTLPAGTDIDRITFDGNLTVNPSATAYLQGPTPSSVANLRELARSNERRILNPDGWQSPETHQFSVGYQRQIGSEILFYVDLLHARTSNLIRLRDLNAPASYRISPEQVDAAADPSTLVRTPAEADASRPVAPVNGGARSIIVSESGGEARYAAANLNLQKDRGNDWYAYRVSYTLSRLRNDTEDINFRAQDSNNFQAEWGPSINDRTHLISGILYAHAKEELSLSIATLVQSGQPVNRVPDARIFGTTDLNGDGRSFADAYSGNSDREPGESRNSDRLPWSTLFDLGLQYRLPLPVAGIEVRADVFNVLNTTNLSGYANNATQSNQIQTGPAGSGIVRKNAGAPRQFQFGVRYLF